MQLTRLGRTPFSRLLVFILGAAFSISIATFVSGMVIGMLGPVRPMVAMAVVSAIASAALLMVTIGLLRHEGVGAAALGLPVNRFRVREFGLGFVLSLVLFLAVAWTQSTMVDANWSFQGARGALAAVQGLPLVGSMVLAEELLFRGAALRYLRAMWGDHLAIVVSAVLFGAYHLVGSQYWGMGAVFQFLMPVFGGLLFGWAALRTGGLALPIGLHLGGNWVQASIAAFKPTSDASIAEPIQELWRIPIGLTDAQQLSAPDLFPRLPYLFAVALAGVVTWQLLRVLQRQPTRTT